MEFQCAHELGAQDKPFDPFIATIKFLDVASQPLSDIPQADRAVRQMQPGLDGMIFWPMSHYSSRGTGLPH